MDNSTKTFISRWCVAFIIFLTHFAYSFSTGYGFLDFLDHAGLYMIYFSAWIYLIVSILGKSVYSILRDMKNDLKEDNSDEKDQ